MHPQTAWDVTALKRLLGQTETLTLEFKRCDALRPFAKLTKRDRVLEAARDVAGMANEQGGTIVYGILEADGLGFHEAIGLDTGFAASEGIGREWFLQVMRDNISPPLTDLEVVQVHLDTTHIALVVLVPQSRGGARQTSDRLFPRRDAQGLRNMTAQEIEDVRSRFERPVLELDVRVSRPQVIPSGYKFDVVFDVVNNSSAVAHFAVVTLAAKTPNDADSPALTWLPLPEDSRWPTVRWVFATGTSPRWSPISPGFRLVTDAVSLTVAKQQIEGNWRSVGITRIDHDGGARQYWVEFGPHAGAQLRLRPYPGDLDWRAFDVPRMFEPVS